ncbi:type II secretion system minor pseudopilin GspJ [Luteimonas sp. R10]|uniref:type II secretion system minor pseudopilin GspJ n=1 Tax=Luteimonas sp. R10 TaxID=3108176 RepID=UPI003084D896|nr:type II secretion system minor pseudopilin GspJ [Luteimonas sp. R10]
MCARSVRCRRRLAHGFTLVEMLVALAVFALLSAAGVTVLAYAADNQGVLRERMQRIGEVQRARAVLRADLSQAAPRPTRNAAGHPAVQAFTGSADAAPGLLFALVRRGWSNPEQAPRASLQYVEYRLVEDRLERGTRPALDGAVLGTPQVLLRGVRTARAHYRYQGEWMDGWPGGADRVPEALQLDLQIDGIGDVRQLFLMPGQPL